MAILAFNNFFGIKATLISYNFVYYSASNIDGDKIESKKN